MQYQGAGHNSGLCPAVSLILDFVGRVSTGTTRKACPRDSFRDTPFTEPCRFDGRPGGLFAEGTLHALYYTQRAVWRQDTSNSVKAGITLSGAGFPLTPSLMPSCAASRLKASSNRFLPLAWSRCLERLRFTLPIGSASTRTCGTEELSSQTCETKLGVSIRRYILRWRPPGTGRQVPAHEAAVPGRCRLQPKDSSWPAPT